MTATPTDDWIKATASTNTGDCVEMRRRDGSVQVRDSKNGGAGATLTMNATSFAVWIDAARRGEFDELR